MIIMTTLTKTTTINSTMTSMLLVAVLVLVLVSTTSSSATTTSIPVVGTVNAEQSLSSTETVSTTTDTVPSPTRNDDTDIGSVDGCIVTDENDHVCKQETSKKYRHNYNGSPSGLGNHVKGDTKCGVYLALSTLPGTGLGMFAGRNFKEEEVLMAGDHNIPIVDMEEYHPDLEFFLWDSYTWNADAVAMDHLGKHEVSVASPGFGAAANSFMDFVNVEEWISEEGIGGYHYDDGKWDPHIELHRSKDPGVGAFTNYHSRLATAKSDIQAGQELFVSYGNSWFKNRESWLGPVPIKGSHAKAESLLRKFYAVLGKWTAVRNDNTSDQSRQQQLYDELYESLMVKMNDIWSSRTIAALPSTASEARDAMTKFGGKVKDWKESTMTRSVEFLEENGVCVDNLYLDRSTIRQAGHGAFAARPLPKDSVILPVPLIHIPDRTTMDMYEWVPPEEGSDDTRDVPDQTRPNGKQLLLNYVLGHRDSTMLLSPYGPAFNFINHNQTRANVKIRWADPKRSNHHPEMLNKSVGEFEDIKFSSLAFELVALRDIQQGEEIFLDYGDEWEHAWQEHVKTWTPTDRAQSYVSATQLNKSPQRLKTVFEQLSDPYPDNVVVQINKAWVIDKERDDEDDDDFRPSDITYSTMTDYGYAGCDILRYEVVKDETEMDNVDDPEPGSHYYYVVAYGKKMYDKIPRRAFKFWDNTMTMDMYLPNVFRHDIRIPDDIMPEAWKNLKHGEESSTSEAMSEAESTPEA